MGERLGVARFEVHQVDLGPKRGGESSKPRPCLVVSPDEMNRHLHTVLVAPLASHRRSYPTRVPVKFRGTDGQVVLDQIRTVDKVRLIRRLGTLDQVTARRVLDVLAEMFAP